MELLQNKSPKIDANTLLPASYPPNPEQEWWAPPSSHHPKPSSLNPPPSPLDPEP